MADTARRVSGPAVSDQALDGAPTSMKHTQYVRDSVDTLRDGEEHVTRGATDVDPRSSLISAFKHSQNGRASVDTLQGGQDYIPRGPPNSDPRSAPQVVQPNFNLDDATAYGQAVSVPMYHKHGAMVTDGIAASVRIDVPPGTSSQVELRAGAPGRITATHSTIPSLPSPDQKFSSHRKAEQILGAKFPSTDKPSAPPATDGHRHSIPETIVEHPEILRPGSTQERRSRSASLRSSRLPLSSNPVDPGSLAHLQQPNNPSTNPKRFTHLLPPLSTSSASNFSRQYIPRTPYPGFEPGITPLTLTTPPEAEPVLLHLCWNRRNGDPARYWTVVIPSSRQPLGGDDKGLKGGSPPSSFDDEKLFRLLKAEYRKRRGWGRRIFSLRTIRSLSLIYSTPNALEVGAARAGQPSMPTNPHLTRSSFLDAFKRPNRVRGAHLWRDWLRQLSTQHLSSGHPDENHTKLTVEFIDGWSVVRLVLVFLLSTLLGLATGVVWIVFGIDGQGQTGVGSAEARVTTGVLLSGLVLLLSWILLAAWMLLSWLVL
ncbi:MAG: hypothetical protein M1815_005058 [Lichina confinis]|nr:MAG: hypothetical protein M1815_005058 [Lichina confinis]